jgi:hypothetical protein
VTVTFSSRQPSHSHIYVHFLSARGDAASKADANISGNKFFRCIATPRDVRGFVSPDSLTGRLDLFLAASRPIIRKADEERGSPRGCESISRQLPLPVNVFVVLVYAAYLFMRLGRIARLATAKLRYGCIGNTCTAKLAANILRGPPPRVKRV